MALAADLVALDIERKHAEALGDAVETLAATGSTPASAAQITESLVFCNSASGGTAFGFKLPKIPMSKTGRHVVFNQGGTTIRVYVNDPFSEGVMNFGTLAGTTAYTDIPSNETVTFYKILSDTWAATQ